MPDIGWPELLIIILIVVVIFGAGRLPEVGGTLGRSVREFRSNLQTPDKEIEPKSPGSASTDAPKASEAPRSSSPPRADEV